MDTALSRLVTRVAYGARRLPRASPGMLGTV